MMKPGDLALMIRLPPECGVYEGPPYAQPGEVCTILADGTPVTSMAGYREPTFQIRAMSGREHYAWKSTLRPLPPLDELTETDNEETMHESR
jgi:hypothetical protein